MSGPNGNTPRENLTHLRSKPVYAEPATLERSKCEAHPTKRAWPEALEAIREAEARSEAAKMPIVAYKCDTCQQFHLCKRANAHPGSIVERETLPGREEPIVLGNREARIRALTGFVEGRKKIASAELAQFLGVGVKTYGPMMRSLGWHNTRGRHAKWIPNDTPTDVDRFGRTQEEQTADAPKTRHLAPVEESMTRHPAALHAGWRPMTNLDPIRHMPLGDLLDTLRAAGMEFRIQVREG